MYDKGLATAAPFGWWERPLTPGLTQGSHLTSPLTPAAPRTLQSVGGRDPKSKPNMSTCH